MNSFSFIFSFLLFLFMGGALSEVVRIVDLSTNDINSLDVISGARDIFQLSVENLPATQLIVKLPVVSGITFEESQITYGPTSEKLQRVYFNAEVTDVLKTVSIIFTLDGTNAADYSIGTLTANIEGTKTVTCSMPSTVILDVPVDMVCTISPFDIQTGLVFNVKPTFNQITFSPKQCEWRKSSTSATQILKGTPITLGTNSMRFSNLHVRNPPAQRVISVILNNNVGSWKTNTSTLTLTRSLTKTLIPNKPRTPTKTIVGGGGSDPTDPKAISFVMSSVAPNPFIAVGLLLAVLLMMC